MEWTYKRMACNKSRSDEEFLRAGTEGVTPKVPKAFLRKLKREPKSQMDKIGCNFFWQGKKEAGRQKEEVRKTTGERGLI